MYDFKFFHSIEAVFPRVGITWEKCLLIPPIFCSAESNIVQSVIMC